MIALLVVGLALPLFAAVAFGIVASEGYRDQVITGHRSTPATRSPRRLTALTVRRVGWLTLAQTCALLAGLVLRVVSQH
jgi:hypothetical protein